MATTGGDFTPYNHVEYEKGLGSFNFSTDTIKMALFTSSFVVDLTDTTFADLSGEIAAANGYTAGGVALTGVTWTQSGAVAKLDSVAASWTASGGDLTARYGVIYDVTASNKLLGYFLLDATDADVTSSDGNAFTVDPNATNGFLRSGPGTIT